jgi:predicted ATPase
LVTSRERLNLAGEWVFEVGGLECPPPAGVEEIEAYSAVRLFVQTARQVRPDFGLLPADRPWVAAICRLTSGMPLALGLAAAWVRLLACQQIAEEIQHNLDVLAGAHGETSGRQASMRQIFDQSWGRLSEAEQRVFRQLAVFRGGFDQQAARDVLGADLQVLAGLMDKTFLQSTQAGRYDCHDLLRQYGAEKLAAAGEVEATRARHYAHFLRMAEANEGRLQQGPSLFGEFQEKFAAMFWLIREQANLQAALEWSLQGDPPRDAAGAQRLRAAMHQRWHGYGVHLLEW